jgi:hypothetical protein
MRHATKFMKSKVVQSPAHDRRPAHIRLATVARPDHFGCISSSSTTNATGTKWLVFAIEASVMYGQNGNARLRTSFRLSGNTQQSCVGRNSERESLIWLKGGTLRRCLENCTATADELRRMTSHF